MNKLGVFFSLEDHSFLWPCWGLRATVLQSQGTYEILGFAVPFQGNSYQKGMGTCVIITVEYKFKQFLAEYIWLQFIIIVLRIYIYMTEKYIDNIFLYIYQCFKPESHTLFFLKPRVSTSIHCIALCFCRLPRIFEEIAGQGRVLSRRRPTDLKRYTWGKGTGQEWREQDIPHTRNLKRSQRVYQFTPENRPIYFVPKRKRWNYEPKHQIFRCEKLLVLGRVTKGWLNLALLNLRGFFHIQPMGAVSVTIKTYRLVGSYMGLLAVLCYSGKIYEIASETLFSTSFF